MIRTNILTVNGNCKLELVSKTLNSSAVEGFAIQSRLGLSDTVSRQLLVIFLHDLNEMFCITKTG
ncbi:hypothetical protein AZ32_00715 [Vibrio cholerae O1 biovar El Tor str. L-3226]|nr:hypothetical protein AZ32_00715 [Vibrio cholerae O1 biovar El Tor str. L-3226]KEA49208.1 hypothetical protein CD57_15120 [Vibrio cholerae O1 biovar El Tor]